MACSRVNYTKKKDLLFIQCKEKTNEHNLEIKVSLLSVMFYVHSHEKSSEGMAMLYHHTKFHIPI